MCFIVYISSCLYQCTFQSPFSKLISVVWVVFLVWWVGFLGGFFQNLWVSLVATFLARDWNLHVINSHVTGAIGWSFMRWDAAWHEWVLVAIAVVIDGMLAVSAQCGCCHHFTYALSGLFSLASFFLVCILFVVCIMAFHLF